MKYQEVRLLLLVGCSSKVELDKCASAQYIVTYYIVVNPLFKQDCYTVRLHSETTALNFGLNLHHFPYLVSREGSGETVQACLRQGF